ncbi:hypothetical protein F4678DRAFT_412102 [Xylaria arbuscula]|nr:hypothetical protein F4678DRAFT_412102 [Xylaria arbuscula]
MITQCTMLSNEKKRYLPLDDDETSMSSPFKINSRSRHLRLHKILCTLQLVFILFNAICLIILTKSSHDIDKSTGADFGRTLRSAQDAIEYVEQNFDDDAPNPFAGEPRPELNQAWSDLLRSTTIKIYEPELKSMNMSSLPLKDGSGYIGFLEAWHMLHCVKRLYQIYYPDHYPEQLAGGALAVAHRDHCIRVLMQGIMCNADTTLNTYFWKSPGKIKGDPTGPRRCTNWSRLQDWADERDVNVQNFQEMVDNLVPIDEEI